MAPQESVDTVRRLIAAFNRQDYDAVLELADPEIEFHSALVEKQAYSGYAGVRQYLETLDSAWSDWHTEDDRFVAAGEDQVLHLYRIVGLGKGSGVPVQQDLAALWIVRAGKVLRGEVFLDQADGFHAAGLRP
jgi:ketosteroid isomerase-like protein